MEVRRGVDPIRYQLMSEGEQIGTITATSGRLLEARFTGFPTTELAERAGWLARSARQSDAAGRRANPGGTFVLARSDDAARVEPDQERGSWSVVLTLAAEGTPDVFVLSRARRMWESIRRAGLGRTLVPSVPEGPYSTPTASRE